jgi:hypothetical protein
VVLAIMSWQHQNTTMVRKPGSPGEELIRFGPYRLKYEEAA